MIRTSKSASLLNAGCLVLLLCASSFAQTATGAARKVDEFGDIQASDLIARLDNFAVQLQDEPKAKGFLVVYRTRRDLPGLSNRYSHRMEGYLVKSRGIDPKRLITVDGGEASCLIQEIWIVPPGATPTPRADAYPSSYQPSVYKFDEHYYGEEGDQYYWRDSLNDLLEGLALELQRNPKSNCYLVAYNRANHDGWRAARSLLRRERNFLIKNFGIKPGRIRTIDGGYREWPTMELWIADKKGAVPIISSYRYSPRRRRR